MPWPSHQQSCRVPALLFKSQPPPLLSHLSSHFLSSPQPPYLGFLISDHVQLLLSYPGLSFISVIKVLLGQVRSVQPVSPLSHLILQPRPHLLQLFHLESGTQYITKTVSVTNLFQKPTVENKQKMGRGGRNRGRGDGTQGRKQEVCTGVCTCNREQVHTCCPIRSASGPPASVAADVILRPRSNTSSTRGW